MKKRTPVTRETLIRLWNAEPRKVPLAVMLTTAELESGIGKTLYDATAERYEKGLHSRNPQWTASDCTSYGLFQILGINWLAIGKDLSVRSPFAGYPDEHVAFVSGTWPLTLDDLIRIQMRAYDMFMGTLIRKHKLPKAFRVYNGSGPAADRYQAKAETVHARLQKDY